ncbi:MAG TPA: hypothetical protein VF855_12060, partial [Acidimicrobiales bacterium]
SEGDEAGDGDEVTVASGRRWTVPIAVLAIAALIGLGAVVSGRAPGEPETASTPTTAAESVAPPPTTARPSTSVGAVVERFTAPSGMPAGLTLVGLTRGQRVTARLALGEVAARPIAESVFDQVDQGYLDDLTGFAVGQNALFRLMPAMVVPVDIDQPVVLVNACGALGAVRDWVWLLDCMQDESVKLRRAPIDSPMTGVEVSLPAWANPEGVDGRGSLLLSTPAGHYVLAETAPRPAVLTRNALVVAGRDVVVEYACDDELRCHYQLIDRLTGTTGRIDLGEAERTAPVPFGVLSPDDRWLILPEVASLEYGRALLVDLVEGSTSDVELNSNTYNDHDHRTVHPVWSPDSRWLFWIDPGDGLFAMDVETRVAHRVGKGTMLDYLSGLVLVPPAP